MSAANQLIEKKNVLKEQLANMSEEDIDCILHHISSMNKKIIVVAPLDDTESASTICASESVATTCPSKKVVLPLTKQVASWADLSSTKETADDGNESDDSIHGGLGATTVASDDWRTAKSRSSVARSTGTKKKKLAKHQAYIEAKKKAAGEEFKDWVNDGQSFLITDEERASRAAAATGTDMDVGIETYTKLVQQASKQKVSWIETWSQMFCERPVMPKSTTDADLKIIEARITVGDDFCSACHKHGLKWGGHRDSKQHQSMLAWHASCDALMGETRGARPYAQGMKLPPSRILDEESLVAHWGNEVMLMADKAMTILRRKGILARVSNNRPQEHIQPQCILAVKLAFVEFESGSGKYENGSSRIRWPRSLIALIPRPKVDNPMLTWLPVVTISFVEEEERRLAKYMMEEAAEDIELATCELDVGIEPQERTHFASKALVMCCQEQLQWDPPAAWYFPTRACL